MTTVRPRSSAAIASLAVVLLAACSRSALPMTPAPTHTARPSASPSRTPTENPTATTTATATPSPTATIGPTPRGGGAELVFGVVERVPAGYSYGPILLFHQVEGRTRAITPGGYELLGVSPDGERLLARHESRLVLLDFQGAEVRQISENLMSTSPPAVWLPGTQRVAFLEDGPEGRLQIYDAVAGERQSVPGTEAVRGMMRPSSAGVVVLLGGPCEPDDSCREAWRLDVTSHELQPLVGWLRPVLSPQGDFAAFLYLDTEGRRRLALAPADGSREVRIGVPGDNILDYSWSPSGLDLLVVALVRSDYSGRWFGSRQFVVTAGAYTIRELPQTGTANALGLWSPDGADVILTGTEPAGNGYQITLNRIDVADGKVETLDPGVDLSRSNYVFVSFMAWRPLR